MDKTVITILFVVLASFAVGYLVAALQSASLLRKYKRIIMEIGGGSYLTREKEFSGISKEAQEFMRLAANTYKEMMKLSASMEQPSKNASHSLYKNDLKDQFSALNIQRLEYLQRAVDAGYDPMIDFQGTPTKMSMIVSMYLSEILSKNRDTKPVPTPEKPKSRHLSLIKEQ